MRDFFIGGLERLVSVIVVVMGLGVLVFAGMATSGGGHMGPGGMGGGVLAGLLVLVAGGIYVILVGGFLYMLIAIQQNTRRSAEALEKLLLK